MFLFFWILGHGDGSLLWCRMLGPLSVAEPLVAMAVALMQPAVIISRSLMMVTPAELKDNALILVVGMMHDAELRNRQALAQADDLCLARAGLAEQRDLAIAFSERASTLERGTVRREAELLPSC